MRLRLLSRIDPCSWKYALRRADQPLDRREPLVAEVDAELVHVERDVPVADPVRQFLRVRPDVVPARLRMRERVLDRRPDRRFDLIDPVDVDAGEDAGQRYG